MEIIKILRIAFLFLAIWWTIVNTGKMIYRSRVSTANILIQAIGITGTIVLFFDGDFL